MLLLVWKSTEVERKYWLWNWIILNLSSSSQIRLLVNKKFWEYLFLLKNKNSLEYFSGD